MTTYTQTKAGVWVDLPSTPVAKTDSTAKKRPVAMGKLTTHQATDELNRFFNLRAFEKDDVLTSVGITRADLAKLLYDEEIYQAADLRTEALKSNEYRLNPSEGKVAEVIYGQLDVHMDSILQATMNAKFYGYSVCELVWDKNTRLVGEVVEKPLQWFEPTNDNKLKYHPNNYHQPILVDTRFKFLLQRNKPTYDNPQGEAVLSRLYWAWFFRQNGWRFWSKFLERFGTPLLIGKTPNDTTALANALAAANSSSVTAIGEDEEVQVIQAGAAGQKAFKEYDDTIITRYVKVILGQTLTSGTDSGGTYGQAVIHAQQQELKFESDKKLARKAVQWFIDAICDLNGFERVEFEWVTQKGLQEELAKRDKDLYEQGVRFSRDYYADQYDIDESYISIAEGQIPEPNKQDIKKPKQPNVSAQVMSFLASAKDGKSNKVKFTPEQERIEDIAENSLSQAGSTIPQAVINNAIAKANTAEDALDALFEAVGRDLSVFEIENALMAADVLGYADSQLEG